MANLSAKNCHLKTFKYVTLNYEDSTNYGCLDPIVFLDGIEANEMLKQIIHIIIKTSMLNQ
ncbi:hypothetical protein ACQKH8_16215 [Staphylococcus aureus]